MKKIFNAKLYLEGLRQTKLMGIVLSVIFIVGSILGSGLEVLSYMSMENPGYTHVELMGLAPLLVVFMLIGPILLVMNMFSFLNKRKASDFYHSVPNTRVCIFMSFLASISTWIVGIIVPSVLINSLIFTLSPIHIMNGGFILYAILSYLAGALLVTSIVLLAKTITGTGITNVIVGGMIGFFPRIILAAFTSLVANAVRIADIESLGMFTNFKYNIPINFSLGIFASMNSMDEALNFTPGIIYTFVLALLYFVAAGFLFSKRKSETAEKGAPNRFMQHVYRCAISFPVTLVIIAMLFQRDVQKSELIAIFTIIGFITLIIYFGYELLTTRKFKNLAKAIPIFVVIIVADIIFGMSIGLVRDTIFSKTPDAQEISGVRIIDDYGMYGGSYGGYGGIRSYNDLLLEDFYLEDDKLAEYVSTGLKDTIDIVKSGEYRYYEETNVSIKTVKGDEFKRRIQISQEGKEYIRRVTLTDEEYSEKKTKLPDSEGLTIQLNSHMFNMNDTDKMNELWKVYSEEYNSLNVEDKIRHNDINSWEQNFLNDQINVLGYVGLKKFSSLYKISSKTPKAMAMIIKMNNEVEKEKIFGIIDICADKSVNLDENSNYHVYMRSLKEDAHFSMERYGTESIYDGLKSSDVEKVISIIKNKGFADTINEKNVFLIDAYSYDGGKSENGSLYFTLSDEDVKELKQLLTNQSYNY